MADEMPDPSRYDGLSRKVLDYSTAFQALIAKAKQRPVEDADWATFETIVDPARFERVGVFLGPEAEVIDWPTYKHYVGQYGGATTWEGTLRHITEQDNRVILELEERNTRGGETHVSNTVTIYEFDAAGKLHHLDVYVMSLGTKAA